MNLQQAEDFMIDYNLEQAPVWEAEERQAASQDTRKALDILQDFIAKGFREPKIPF